jgi:hypothetical protein
MGRSHGDGPLDLQTVCLHSLSRQHSVSVDAGDYVALRHVGFHRLVLQNEHFKSPGAPGDAANEPALLYDGDFPVRLCRSWGTAAKLMLIIDRRGDRNIYQSGFN